MADATCGLRVGAAPADAPAAWLAYLLMADMTSCWARGDDRAGAPGTAPPPADAVIWFAMAAAICPWPNAPVPAAPVSALAAPPEVSHCWRAS